MEYYELGSVVKAHGIKGELVIYIKTDGPFKDHKLPGLYIGSDNDSQEFELLSIRLKGNLATVRLKGIDDRNAAESQVKKKVFVDINALPEPGEKEFVISEVIGYRISDREAGDIGEIQNVYELPQHPVFAVDYKGKEALIPATPDFILKIDRKKRVISMELPEGLLEIYS